MTNVNQSESGLWTVTLNSVKDAARLYFDPISRVTMRLSSRENELVSQRRQWSEDLDRMERGRYHEMEPSIWEEGKRGRGEVHQRRLPLVLIEGLTKVFYTDEIETHALSGVYLNVAKGEFVAIQGPSGCGKSTLLSIIGLLDTPTSGKYLLNGHEVESLDFAQRARIRNQEIGFIFQSFNLIGDLTVYENVELPLTYRSGMSAVERRRRVLESLERVSMAHRMKHYPAQLSGGQQQRVAVARALAGSPSILLADEPTGNLDSRNGEAVMELLANLHREGATIAMVTHDPRFARHAERNINLFDGKVVEDGSVLEQLLELS